MAKPSRARAPSALPELDPAELRTAALQLGVGLDAGQVNQCMLFARQLVRWNAVHNLTAIDGAQILTHHLLDSLALVQHLPAAAQRLLDVGSGGGLPGIPIAIARPALQVTLLDKVEKKCAFLTQVRLELRLPRVQVVHARVEQCEAGPFDVIVSRAFSALPELVAWTEHLLAPGGCWLALKGRVPEAELAALPSGIAVRTVRPLAVPGLDEQRHLIELAPRAAAAA